MTKICERKVDELGRIVLPVDIRAKIGITPKSSISIYEDGGKIILCKTEPSCKLCGCTDGINEDLHICSDCMERIKKY